MINADHVAYPNVQSFRNKLYRRHLQSLKQKPSASVCRSPKFKSLPYAEDIQGELEPLALMQYVLWTEVSVQFKGSTSYAIVVPRLCFATSADNHSGAHFACRAVVAVLANATRGVQVVGHMSLGLSAFHFCCLAFEVFLARSLSVFSFLLPCVSSISHTRPALPAWLSPCRCCLRGNRAHATRLQSRHSLLPKIYDF